MNELIKINYESDRPTVLARDLHHSSWRRVEEAKLNA